MSALKHWHIGLCVQCDDDDAALPQPLDTFISPVDAHSSVNRVLIPDCALPVTPQMGSQAHRSQNAADGGEVDRGRDSALDESLRQIQRRPMG
jgi:hypothetical protein